MTQTVKFAKQHCGQWGSQKYYYFSFGDLKKRAVLRAGVVIK